MQLDLKKGSRARTLAILTLVIMAVFIVRLFYLQVIRHDYYVAQANREQLKQLTIPAKRGEIYAMDSGTPVPLVLNQAVYTVFADPKIVDEPQKMIDTIRRVAGGNARDNLDGLLAKKGFTLPDSRHQSHAQASRADEKRASKRPWIPGGKPARLP